MVESVRVPKNCPNDYRKMAELRSVPENDRIRAIPGKGRIRASTEKLSEQVPKNGRISISTGKW